MSEIAPEIRQLLDFIASGEAPRGYSQIYAVAEKKLGRQPLTQMTVKDVQLLQGRMRKVGSKSTAVGRYQFIKKTLKWLVKTHGIDPNWPFDEGLQDYLAVHLLKKRGLQDYLDGRLTTTRFCNQLAMEWASLPVVSGTIGRWRNVERGESYYTGDRLNKALHGPEDFERVVRALRAPRPDVHGVDMRRPVEEEQEFRSWLIGLLVFVIVAALAAGFVIFHVLS